MVKKVLCALTTSRSSSTLHLDAPLLDEMSFSSSYALMIGAAMANLAPSSSDCEPPRIRPWSLSRDRGIVKPTPRKGLGILGAAAPGLPCSRILAHGHGCGEPTSGESSGESGVSSPQSGSCVSSPRAPLDFGLDIGAQIDVLMRDMHTTASTTASLDLLAPLAGLGGGQTTADLAEHLEQLACR